MIKKIVEALVAASGKPRSTGYRVVAFALGGILFTVIIPAVLYVCANGIEKYVLVPRWRSVELVIAWASVSAGLALLAWAVFVQLTTGRGTPVPAAPTQRLITSGPYKYTRNPIQLGAMIYYFGLGTLFGSLQIGVIVFLLALPLGSFHHKFVEEKELVARFGKEYEDYRAKTPFLIPKF